MGSLRNYLKGRLHVVLDLFNFPVILILMCVIRSLATNALSLLPQRLVIWE